MIAGHHGDHTAVCRCNDARTHASWRYQRGETHWRLRERELMAEGRTFEAEGARQFGDIAHRAAVAEVRNPVPNA